MTNFPLNRGFKATLLAPFSLCEKKISWHQKVISNKQGNFRCRGSYPSTGFWVGTGANGPEKCKGDLESCQKAQDV